MQVDSGQPVARERADRRRRRRPHHGATVGIAPGVAKRPDFRLHAVNIDLEPARGLAGCARAGGNDVLFGSELGPGTTAALHRAAACGITAASDLSGPGLLVADVVTPLPGYTDGDLPVRQGPGPGVRLDAGKLETLNATTIE